MTAFPFRPASATEAGFSADALNELRLYLATAVAGGSLPGVTVLLARGDRLVLYEAIGRADIAKSVPLEPDALYRLYSMTKPLTAIGMLCLYEEGRWGFDDPVSRYLPEFADFASLPGGRASREPTLRELFTHTGGPSFGETPEESWANVEKLDLPGTRSLDEIIGKFAKMRATFEPGTRWEYGLGMDLQAAIVERISGRRFDRFMQERVFEPLGMRDTGFALSDTQNARLAPGHVMDVGTGALRLATEVEMLDPSFPMGGSSFRSTAIDYARFARMLLNRGSLGDARILKTETADLLFANLLSDDILAGSYGFPGYQVGGGNGFSLNGLLCIDPGKAGRPVGRNSYEWCGAHGTWFWADPEHDIVFVGMTNRIAPHAEIAPLNIVSQELVYRALRRSSPGA